MVSRHVLPPVTERPASTTGTYTIARYDGDFTTEYMRYAERYESVTSAISAALQVVHSKTETLGDVNATTFGTSFSAATIAAGGHDAAPQARTGADAGSEQRVRRDTSRGALDHTASDPTEARADCAGFGIDRPFRVAGGAVAVGAQRETLTDRPMRVTGGIA